MTAVAEVRRDHVALEPANSVTELLRIAVERGTPVAELKELVELHDRMSKRQAEQDFFSAMAAFQAECPSIKKASTAKITSKRSGTSFAYTYAELDEIARVINPIMAKHGLSYGWDSDVNGATLVCVCTVRHKAGHSIQSKFTLPVASEGGMSAQQEVGAALTFAQRRSLSSALGLTTTDEDTDAAPQKDPTPINDDQIVFITDLIAETKTNLPRFLKFIGADSIAEIRAVDYQVAVTALEAKKSAP